MHARSKPKAQSNKVRRTLNILALLVFVGIFSAVVVSLSFSSGPAINNNLVTYTRDDLVCAWAPSADMTQTNVTWYNGSTLFWNGTIAGNSSTLDDNVTTKNDNWICQVTMGNGTNLVVSNASMSINNTAPAVPVMKNSSHTLSNHYQLTEDASYVLYVYASDDDNDSLTYDLTDSNLFDVCAIQNANTGEILCNASHSVIKGSSALGSETAKNHTVRMYATEEGTSGYTAYSDFIFTLMPVNDQPFINQTLTQQSAKVGFNWSLVINQAYDEELNYPINFTISAALNNDTQNLTLGLTITNLTEKTANITFSVPITNSQYGLWNVTINMTDANGTNASRLPSTFMFTLLINSSNFEPTFTTNFTNLSAQTWTQGDAFSIWLEGNDSNLEDLIRFNISPPTDIALRCNVTPFPWIGTLTLVNQSASNGSAFISVANLTNDFVACRYVDFSVYDLDDEFKLLGGRVNVSNFLLNIVNVNDPPVIYERGYDGNMSNLSIKKFQRLTYRVNASDPDSKTYDVANTGTLTYYSDHEWFTINSTTGAVSIYPDNDSFIGNWVVNITVGDGEYNYTRQMFLEINNNSVPTINIPQNDLVFMQNDNITINFSAVESENESMNLSFYTLTLFSNETYNTSFVLLNNSYAGGSNTQYMTLNMSRNAAINRNELVGNHRVNVIFSDFYDSYFENISTGILNFTILNENDAPFFDQDRDNNSDLVIFDFVVYNYPYSIMINATDLDTFLGTWANESLTFSYANESAGVSNISLTPVNNSNGSVILNFTGTLEGNQSITIIVTDASGVNTSQVVSFTVLAQTTLPIFHLIKPYFNTTLNETLSEFASAVPYYTTNTTTINISENSNVLFDAFVTNDSVSGNYLTYYWYFDGVLNSTLGHVEPMVNSSFTKYFNFFTSNMTHNVTLIARDVRYSESSWTWLVNVTNVNRPPIYCPGRMQDLMVNGTTIISNYLSGDGYGDQRFYDPDDDPLNSGEGPALTCDDYLVGNLSSLTYQVYKTLPCEILEFSFEGSDLTLVPTLMGLCQVQFNATDEYNQSILSSDIIDIVVIGAEPSEGEDSPSSNGGSSVRTQTVTVPLEEEVDKPVPIKILAPSVVTTYANKTIYIPFKIKNTWTTDVIGIELGGFNVNETMGNESNVTLTFDKNYINVLPVGQEMDVTLAVANYRTEGPFEVIVSANVKDPEFNDSTTILISTLEQMSRGDVVKAKITFAKDLLSENPVCRELNDLLEKAEQEADKESYDEAIRMVDGVINGCKYLMKEEELRKETPSIIKQGFDAARKYTLEIVAGAGLLLILTLVFYAIAALRKKISEQ